METTKRNNRIKWTVTQIEWLKLNYPTSGINGCAEYLNIPPHKVKDKANYLKLKMVSFDRHKKKSKKFAEYSVNPEPFINIREKHIAYLLGFIWADGNIQFSSRRAVVRITCGETDISALLDILIKTGKWSLYKSSRLLNKGKIGRYNLFTTSNRPLVAFLKDHDYDIKSGASASKILEKIPKELKRYFFLGLIDGDGCWSMNHKKHDRQFVLTSCYLQEWNFIEKLFNELRIEYKIYRKTQQLGRSSIIEFKSREKLQKMFNYLYPNGFEIGLKRKYNKALECLQ